MFLSINYSTQAALLFQSGRIPLDYFKCPDWPDLVEEALAYRPVAVHFTLSAGNGSLQNADWKLVETLLQRTGTPYVNLHLEAMASIFPDIPVHTTEDYHRQHITEALASEVKSVVDRFGPERVIVENVPYYLRKKEKVLRPSVEPEVIGKIVHETGCGLLLDISHARIAANALGLDEKAYMQSLPVDCLRELHFTGLHTIEGVLRDHLEILDGDWPVLEWALEQARAGKWARPWMLAFEYGGVGEKFAWRSSEAVIATQEPRLFELISQI